MNEAVDVSKYICEFWNCVDGLRDNTLYGFMNFFWNDMSEEFTNAPGSRSNHHGYNGGLLEHSMSVTLLAERMANHFNNIGIKVKKDIIVVGGILHDLGKIKAYHCVDDKWEYTSASSMIYHIPLGYGMVLDLFRRFNEKCELPEHKIDDKKAQKILHIVLSHHGRKEWGSPIQPQTPEAFIVHKADMLDAGIKKLTTTGPYDIYHN